MRLIAIVALVLGVLTALSGAAAQSRAPLPLVKSFYVKGFNDDNLPMTPRLKGLYDGAMAMSKKRNEPVPGIDFSWTLGAQDAEDGWEKTIRYKVLKGDDRQATVQVTFRLFRKDRPRELHYVLERAGQRWLVADVRYVDQKETLAGLLTRGAEGED
jgi:hypothetical protein